MEMKIPPLICKIYSFWTLKNRLLVSNAKTVQNFMQPKYCKLVSNKRMGFLFLRLSENLENVCKMTR